MSSVPEEFKMKIPLTLGAVIFMAVVVWQLAAVYNEIDSASDNIQVLKDNANSKLTTLDSRMEKRYGRTMSEFEYLNHRIKEQGDVINQMHEDIAVMKALNQKWNIE